MYKSQVQTKTSQNKSFLIYVLFIPALLYFTQYYVFKQTNTDSFAVNPMEVNINNTNGDINLENVDFDSLLTSPYPESSIIS